ncbi:MAG: hypothetical protein QOJ16_1469, partial [Acidobacteriota bacterium]|nr:hypothetical protein [Acidobacteriota bacterium]
MSELRPARHLLDEDYWIDKLAGVESRPLYRTSLQAMGASEIRRALPAALTESLERAASGNDAGIYLLLLAALVVLLSRYTGADDPLVASTPFPRAEEAPSGLVFFRPRLADDPTLARLLACLTGELEEIYNHLDFDFEGLRRRFRSAGLGDERALFDIGLTYDLFNQDSPWLTHLDLWFGVERESDGLWLRLRDGKGQRSPTYLGQLGRHFESALRELLAHSDRPVREIDLLCAEERSEILAGLNPGEAAYPSEQSLAELFAEQAARDPGAVAVVGPERT